MAIFAHPAKSVITPIFEDMGSYSDMYSILKKFLQDLVNKNDGNSLLKSELYGYRVTVDKELNIQTKIFLNEGSYWDPFASREKQLTIYHPTHTQEKWDKSFLTLVM